MVIGYIWGGWEGERGRGGILILNFFFGEGLSWVEDYRL